MLLAYKFRIYPTLEQQLALGKSFGCCRWFWNYSLNLCQETYQATGKTLSRFDIQNLLPNLKKEFPWLKTDTYSQCLQYVALNLSTAYQNFFEKRARFPRFKSKEGRKSLSYPNNVKLEGDYIKLPKIGLVYCKQDRKFQEKIRTVTVSKNPDGNYFVSILVEDGKDLPLASSEGKAIGIDVGILDFCTTSDGDKVANPRTSKKHQRNLKKKQQSLSRKKKGSKKRQKAKKLVAKVQSKIKRVREDFLHKLSRKIVNENQVIVVEDLNVKGMVKNRKLSLAISDVSWGQFFTMLKYKSEWEGKIYLEIGRFFPSSKTCNVCLNRIDSLDLKTRFWTCTNCFTYHDRDINAAIMILLEGLRILAFCTSATANRGNVRPKLPRSKKSCLSGGDSL